MTGDSAHPRVIKQVFAAGPDRLFTTTLSVVMVWLLTRIFAALALTRSGGSILVDIQMYEGWASIAATGSAPLGDETWQYPPVMLVPVWLGQLLPWDYRPSFVVLTLIADLGVLIALLALRRSMHGRWTGVWLWASAGVWIGPVLLARLDVFTVLPAVAVFAFMSRSAVSGTFAALGAFMKVWPGALLITLPRRQLPWGLAGFAASALLLWGISVVFIDDAWAFLANQQSRGLNGESLAATPYIVANSLGMDVQFAYRFGSNEVANTSADTTAAFIAGVGIALIVLLVLLRLLGALERALPADVGLIAVLSLVLVSRVFSPQYFIWLGALAAIAMLSPRTRMRVPVTLIVIASLLTQPLYPWFPGAIYSAEPWAVVLHVLRMTLMVGALIYGLRMIVDWRSIPRTLRKPLASREENSHEPQSGHSDDHVGPAQGAIPAQPYSPQHPDRE